MKTKTITKSMKHLTSKTAATAAIAAAFVLAPIHSSQAVITITGGGNVEVKASSDSMVATKAASAQEDGENFGLGLSFALGIADNTTSATLGNAATIIGAEDVTISADGNYALRTEGDGASKGSGTGAGGVIALSIVMNDTVASIGDDGLVGALSTTGNVSVNATHVADSVTTAKGDAEGSTAAVGISFGLTVATDNVDAFTDRDITTTDGGNISIVAQGAAASRTEAEASAAGTEDSGEEANDTSQSQLDTANNQTDERTSGSSGSGTESTEEASTSDGPVSFAAGLGINYGKLNVNANADEVTLNADGAVEVRALGNLDTEAVGSGEATKGGSAAIGAGIAINVGEGTVEASVIGATITADGLMVEAGMSEMDVLVSATINAADLIDMSDDIGTLEAGKFADIIAVTASPIENIDELLEDLNRTFHSLRQSGIDEELFDVISGFEALSSKEK